MKFVLKILVLAFLIGASKFTKDQQVAVNKKPEAKTPPTNFNPEIQQASLAPAHKAAGAPVKIDSRSVVQLN